MQNIQNTDVWHRYIQMKNEAAWIYGPNSQKEMAISGLIMISEQFLWENHHKGQSSYSWRIADKTSETAVFIMMKTVKRIIFVISITKNKEMSSILIHK